MKNKKNLDSFNDYGRAIETLKIYTQTVFVHLSTFATD